MPNRFRPALTARDRVHQPRSNPGDAIAEGLDYFFQAKQAEEDREHVEAQRGRENRAAERADVAAEMAFGRFLESEGLREPDMPAEMRDNAEARRSSSPLEGGDIMADRGVGMADREELPRDSVFRSAPRGDDGGANNIFGSMAEAGPEGVDRPVLLPGQYSPGMGFSPRAMYLEDIERPQPFDTRHPPRETIAGREFERIGPDAPTQARTAAQQEFEALIAAGVPEDRARFVQQDDVLARQYLGPDDDPEGRISAEQLVGLGFSPELAELAALDPTLARQLIRDRERPAGGATSADIAAARFSRDVARERMESIVSQLVGRGVTDLRTVLQAVQSIPEFRDADIATTASVENAFRAATRAVGESNEPSASTRERRSQITSVLNQARIRLTDPHHQDVVDMLAGIGPDGGDAEPMTPEQIRQGYVNAGAPPEFMTAINNILLAYDAHTKNTRPR